MLAGMNGETCAVMVVPCPERAEEILLAGDVPCPRCRGVLRPFGNGRTRTVRGDCPEGRGRLLLARDAVLVRFAPRRLPAAPPAALDPGARRRIVG